MANSAIVGALRVLLSLDSAEFESGMKSASRAAAGWQKDLAGIGRQATAVGASLTKALTLPIVGVAAASVKAAIDFESAFAGVSKTVDGVVDASGNLTKVGQEISDGLRNMAKEIPTSVTELTAVAEAAGQLGIKKEDILQFTRTMADLGVTTNLTADQAATATAQIQNIFGAAGKDVDRFGSTLVALGNAGASTEKDIIDMGLRIAGAGHVVNLTQAQVLSFASALSSVGINAEAGGSAISRVFLKINDAVAGGGKKLDEFARIAGMSGAAFKQAFEKDAATATVAFIEGIDRLKKSGENVNATLEGVVGKNIILKDTLLRASGAGQLLREQLDLGNKAWEANTALTTEAGRRYDTTASQLKTLWNQIKDVGITLGNTLLPVLKDFVSAVGPLLSIVAGVVGVFAMLPEPIRLVALGVLALAAAVGPVLYVFGALATGLATLVGAFTAKGLAMRALTALYPSFAAGILSVAGAARVLLLSLGPLVAAITAVWIAWQIGNTERVKNSIAEWALSADNLTAKLYRALTGIEKMTPEQARAAVSATAAAVAAQKQAAALEQTGQQASTAAPKVASVGTASHDAAGKMDEGDKAAKEFAKSLKALGGADALAGAKEVVAQLHAMNGPMNVLPSKLGEMAARLREGAQAAILMGNVKLAEQYMLLAKTLDPIVMFQQRYNVTIGEYVTQAGMAERATEALWEQFNRLAGLTQTIGPLLQDLNPEKFLVPFKAAAKNALHDAGTEGGQSFATGISNGVRDGLSDLAGAFSALAQTTSGGLSDWVKQIGTIVTSTNLATVAGENFRTGLDRLNTGGLKNTVAGLAQLASGAVSAAAALLQATSSTSQAQNMFGGVMSGAAMGSAFGPWGAAIGAVGGALVGLFRGTNGEVKKANTEIEKMMTTLIQTHGPLERLEAKAKAVGLSFAEAWGHQGKAGLKAFQDLVIEFEKRLDAVKSKASGLFDRALQLPTSLPTSTLDQIRSLLDSGALEGEIGEKAQALLDKQGVSWQRGAELADKYKFSVSQLGSAFDAAKIKDDAATLVNDIDEIFRMTGDWGTALSVTRDEMSGLVNEALRTGTELPGNMKPWIEELARSGQLFTDNRMKANDLATQLLGMGDGIPEKLRPILETFRETGELIDTSTGDTLTLSQLLAMLGSDAPDDLKGLITKLSDMDKGLGDSNGKITDLSQLKFGEPVKTQFEDINDEMADALSTLDSIRNGLVTIPAEVRSRVIIDTVHNDYYNTFTGGSGEGPAFGGPQAEGGLHHITKPTWFLAGEKPGGEWASFSGIGGSLADLAAFNPASMMSGSAMGGASPSAAVSGGTDVSGVMAAIQSLGRKFDTLPQAIRIAVQEAWQQA